MRLAFPFLFDAAYWLVFLVVYSTAGAAGFGVGGYLWGPAVWQRGLALAVGYGVFLHAFVIVLCTLKRLLQPRLRASSSAIGSRDFLAWGLNSVFQGIYIASPFKEQINLLFWLRFLYLRLMGMRVHVTSIIGTGCSLRQVEMIRIGKGSVVGINSSISCHGNPDGKTHVQAPIAVGERTLVGTGSSLGPGCTVGDDCVLGAESFLLVDVTIGDDVRLGPRCLLMPGAKVGRGARILPGSVVQGEVPENEVWGGNPAVHVAARRGASGGAHPKPADEADKPSAPRVEAS